MDNVGSKFSLADAFTELPNVPAVNPISYDKVWRAIYTFKSLSRRLEKFGLTGLKYASGSRLESS